MALERCLCTSIQAQPGPWKMPELLNSDEHTPRTWCRETHRAKARAWFPSLLPTAHHCPVQMLCLFSRQGLTCSVFTAKNFARWRRTQTALAQAMTDIVEVHSLCALRLLCLAAALSMAAAQKPCLDSWTECAKDCSLAWSPADTAVSLLLSSSRVPNVGTSSELLHLLLTSDCLRSVQVSASWFGSNTARLRAVS